MQPLMVVGDFEKRRQLGAQRIQIAPLSAVYLLLLEWRRRFTSAADSASPRNRRHSQPSMDEDASAGHSCVWRFKASATVIPTEDVERF
jgi:hypothetical protein